MGFLRYAIRSAKKIQRDYFNQPRIKGFIGEREVQKALAEEEYLIYNIEIKSPKETQIDHILINSKGVIVIETKNYQGLIRGNKVSRVWLQHIRGQTYKMHSPYLQNEYHIDVLKEVVNLDNIPIYSLILFSRNSKLQITELNNVIYIDEAREYIKTLAESNLDVEVLKGLYKEILSLKDDNK